jgi:hypothetical protein
MRAFNKAYSVLSFTDRVQGYPEGDCLFTIYRVVGLVMVPWGGPVRMRGRGGGRRRDGGVRRSEVIATGGRTN